MPDQVTTRFAPSPTGYLHIGGARTALFNWLYARGHKGRFLLRIEDTDRSRHNQAAVDAILEGLSWLGLDWDEPPTSQFANRDRHIEVAQQLLDAGHAYRCYMAPDETDAARNAARADKRRFESPWRNANAEAAPTDAPFTIRFKAPTEGETVVKDVVQGEVRFPNSAFDDLIILRSNGDPTYNLAVVVDDHDMGVNHVIRGDDHLNNAARQQQIYEALGWPVPSFAHVPLIHGQDGAKLSKRHGALGVEAYRDDGFLSDALANYLLRLGWSHGDDEIISRAQAIEWFDTDCLNKAPARLDIDKLKALNAHYIRSLSDVEFVEQTSHFLEQTLDETTKARLHRAAPFIKERVSVLSDIGSAAAFVLLARPLEITGKAAKPLKKSGAAAIISGVLETLTDVSDWTTPTTLDAALQSFVDARGLCFGQIGPARRAALTAGKPAPALGEVLYSLGREEALARLSDGEKTALTLQPRT